ncbi:MAG: CoA pyrophosphatase [Rhodocyclaceae bacterium]|nr:CoA pyrophosphatase [Rhodocyclaceae bacterium]
MRLSSIMSADAFRRAFAAGEDRPVAAEEGLPPRLTPAAVLVPVVDRPDGLTLLLTLRTAHLHDHAGQVSFPGGRAEPGETPVQTALREAEEEIGLPSSRVELLGHLPEYHTVTGFAIFPVVALVSPPFDLRLDAFEVAEAFEPPLSFLVDTANHQRHDVLYHGQQRSYWAMPWRDYHIWGATAGIIVNLTRRLENGKP